MLALSFDMALASATANRPEEEPALKRSLWLTIARHIVQQHPSQDQVTLLPFHCASSLASRQHNHPPQVTILRAPSPPQNGQLSPVIDCCKSLAPARCGCSASYRIMHDVYLTV